MNTFALVQEQQSTASESAGLVVSLALVLLSALLTGWWSMSIVRKKGHDPKLGFVLGFCLSWIGVLVSYYLFKSPQAVAIATVPAAGEQSFSRPAPALAKGRHTYLVLLWNREPWSPAETRQIVQSTQAEHAHAVELLDSYCVPGPFPTGPDEFVISLALLKCKAAGIPFDSERDSVAYRGGIHPSGAGLGMITITVGEPAARVPASADDEWSDWEAQATWFCFICSPMHVGVIRNIHATFSEKAALLDGETAMYPTLYSKSGAALRAMAQEPHLAQTPFRGRQLMRTEEYPVETVADVLKELGNSTYDVCFVAFVAVERGGREWVKMVYQVQMNEAAARGISALPSMYITPLELAATRLRESLSPVPA